MLEAESFGVQRLPANWQWRAAGPTVGRVGDDRVAERSEVDTNLMRPTGLWMDAQEGRVAKALDHFIARDRRSPPNLSCTAATAPAQLRGAVRR